MKTEPTPDKQQAQTGYKNGSQPPHVQPAEMIGKRAAIRNSQQHGPGAQAKEDHVKAALKIVGHGERTGYSNVNHAARQQAVQSA